LVIMSKSQLVRTPFASPSMVTKRFLLF